MKERHEEREKKERSEKRQKKGKHEDSLKWITWRKTKNIKIYSEKERAREREKRKKGAK